MKTTSLILIVIALAIIAIAGLRFIPLLQKESGNLPISEATKIFTSEPLRGPLTPTTGKLTNDGIVSETNKQRQAHNLPTLRPNLELNQAARQKAADMFAKQYFEHISPNGTGPADVVGAAGYTYIVIGENLALGNFKSDTDVVEAWMNSPGHRANILNTGFQEIGVAAIKGTFEGHSTWIAVQEFGTPDTACPTPLTTIKHSFNTLENQQEKMSKELASQQAAIAQYKETLTNFSETISALSTQAKEKIEAGNAKIEEGNKIYQETGSREEAQPYWDEGEALQQTGETLLAEAKAKQAEAEGIQEELTAVTKSYNVAVGEYNKLIANIKESSSDYNQGIQKYNNCLKQYLKSE